ncbi:MAG: hypothetical protein SNJ71_04225, partial [Bacteroidales bacterium]
MDTPKADFEYYLSTDKEKTNPSPKEITLGDEIVFYPTSEADSYSLWTGDIGHDYEKRIQKMEKDTVDVAQKHTGLAMEKIEGKYQLKYTYALPGEYKVQMVATNSCELAKEISSSTSEVKIIKVIDNNVKIINFAIMAKWNDALEEWLPAANTGIRNLTGGVINHEAGTITFYGPQNSRKNLTNLRIDYKAGNAKVYYEGKELPNKPENKTIGSFDLTVDREIEVKAFSDPSKTKKYIITVIEDAYVPSNSANISAVKGTGVIATIDNASNTITFDAVAGTSTVSLEFTIASKSKFKLNGTDIASETSTSVKTNVDLTKTNTVTITSESGNNKVDYTLKPTTLQKLSIDSVSVDGASGIPITWNTANDTVTITISKSFKELDKAKVIFKTQSLTSIEFKQKDEDEDKYVKYTNNTSTLDLNKVYHVR